MKQNGHNAAFLAPWFLIFCFHSLFAQSNFPKLSEFVMRQDNRVLHGFGQGLYRWQTDAIPYFEAMEQKPVVYSSYLTLTDIRAGELPRLEQFKLIHEGWTNSSSGIQYKFIPIVGVSVASIDFDKRQATLSSEFFDQLGITEDAQDQYGIQPTYGLTVFGHFLNNPELWETVKDTLSTKGFDLDHLDFQEIFDNGSDEAIYELIQLRDSVLVLANQELLEQGMLFGDLEVLNGHFDNEIIQLADSLKSVDAPILIRFLHETIAGFSRSYIFSRPTYQQAHQRFVDLIRARGVDNVEFVFHANNSNTLSLAEWYPGDNYVDWTATSVFHALENTTGIEKESQFALDRGKPFMIVESAPTSGKYRPNNIHHPDVWEEWFVPYFDFTRADVNTRLFVYIGIDWNSGQGSFSDWGDTRVQENAELFGKYSTELQNEMYLHNQDFWQLYDPTTGIDSNDLPTDFTLFQNYPNPFNPTTTIRYALPRAGHVRLIILNVAGQVVRELVDGHQTVGAHSRVWDGRDRRGMRAASGVYFYRLQSDGLSLTRKMLFLQ